MNTNDLEPARYAAQLAETINAAQEDLPDDWWQEVLMALHDQLAKDYLTSHHRNTCRYMSLLEHRTIAAWMKQQAAELKIDWHKVPPEQRAAEPEPEQSDGVNWFAQCEAQLPGLDVVPDTSCNTAISPQRPPPVNSDGQAGLPTVETLKFMAKG